MVNRYTTAAGMASSDESNRSSEKKTGRDEVLSYIEEINKELSD